MKFAKYELELSSMSSDFDMSTLSHNKCLLVTESGELIPLDLDLENSNNYEVISDFLLSKLNCDLFEMVSSCLDNVDIYIDQLGKVNGKCKINHVASKLFGMSQMPHDSGLYGNVIFTVRGTFK